MTDLTGVSWGPDLEPFRPQIIAIFAKQRGDAEQRMASSHFQSGGGRNIGLDVLEAYNAALGCLRTCLSGQQEPNLEDLISALDDLIDARRPSSRDKDGYGLATLGEIRRDLTRI